VSVRLGDRGGAGAALGRALDRGGAAADARRDRPPVRPESAAWAFAAHWAADWLRRAQRLSPPPVRPISIVVGDACRDELDPDAPYLRTLELSRSAPGSTC